MFSTYDSPIEYVWAAATLFGVTYKIFQVRDTGKLYRATQAMRDCTARQLFITRVMYTSARLMLTVHTIMLYAAVWALFHEPPPPPLWTVQTLNSTICWIVISLLLSRHAYLGHKWRNQLFLKDYK